MARVAPRRQPPWGRFGAVAPGFAKASPGQPLRSADQGTLESIAIENAFALCKSLGGGRPIGFGYTDAPGMVDRERHIGGSGPRRLIGALLLFWLGAALAGGCGGPVPPTSADWLEGAADAYEQGDDDTAIRQADRFIDQHGRSQEAGEAHYLRGLARARQGQTDQAAEDFTRALDLTRRANLTGRCRLALALLAQRQGQVDWAVALYEQAIESLPEATELRSTAMLRVAALLQEQGKWPEADRWFDRLLYEDPDGPNASAARHRIRARAWSIRAGAFERRHNAIRRRDELLRAGLSARLAPVLDDRLLHAVLVGRYERADQAIQSVGEVRRMVPEAVVTTARD